MIKVESESTFVFVDLRNLDASATLTGILRDFANNVIVSQQLTFTNDQRAYKISASFFNNVIDGDYTFSIVNESENTIYKERVFINKTNAYDLTQNDFSIKIVQNEPTN
ncbi:MAG: hypothetical protein HRU12_11750 [Phaeodactylibacter sp.]|nr:hypothetical protein [Phaeodactylibacter sp.]